MDELDDRIAKENIALALPVVVRDPVETQSQLTSWLSDMLDRKQASNSKRHSEMAPLSRKKLSQSANGRVDAINSLGGDYNVLVSSSILKADELAKLDQLKSATPEWPQTLDLLIREHPREAFIVCTLILCVFVYFGSR
jgi:hypothetical protein